MDFSTFLKLFNKDGVVITVLIAIGNDQYTKSDEPFINPENFEVISVEHSKNNYLVKVDEIWE